MDEIGLSMAFLKKNTKYFYDCLKSFNTSPDTAYLKYSEQKQLGKVKYLDATLFGTRSGFSVCCLVQTATLRTKTLKHVSQHIQDMTEDAIGTRISHEQNYFTAG